MPVLLNRVLENHFQSQKENYEREIDGLNSKVEHLSQEISHLQKLFREENDINDSIRLQVARLTSENMVRGTRHYRTEKHLGLASELSRGVQHILFPSNAL